ncbi:MAG: putative lipid II flippase FtsW, partial [Candidatus Methylomirabilis sp.]|nr:putative lipid II flippase FtsW [Deltaproteobacteria bacterium]
LLMAVGVAMVYSTSSVIAMGAFGDAEHYLVRQTCYALAAFGVIVAVARTPYRFLRRLAYPLMALVFLMLVAVLVPGIGQKIGGARRWLPLGPVRFQPSELAKVVAVLYLAHSLTKKEQMIRSFKVGVFPHLLILGMIGGLILVEPDLGSVVILALTAAVMLFLGGARLSHLLALAATTAPFAVIYVQSNPYQVNRIKAWLNPWEHAEGIGWQLVQSYLAFASGGLAGAGVGGGKQKMYFLPEAHTDFIFAAMAEEWGLLATVFVLGAFAILFWGAISVARRTADRFAMLLALGVGCLLTMEALVNIAITVGLLPTKGLVLPFLSYGGSALVADAFALGMLVSVARHDRENG